mmetsp:Transcript_46932/g.138643  ORF Transcript_46932/g.138643 Transcript_46932/m.138643 type:complete len:200 (+) Transcript_46932:86-685(+)
MAHSVVTPRPASSRRMLTMFDAAAESRPLVGSSQSSSCGRPPMTESPTLRRLLSPPEMPRTPSLSSPMCVSAHASSFRRRRTLSTRFPRSDAVSFLDRRSSAAKPSISRTVSAARKTSSCGTTLEIDLIMSTSTGLPLHRTCPLTTDLGEERPRASVSREVFPEPLAPMIAESLPTGNLHEMSVSTVRGGAFFVSPGTV